MFDLSENKKSIINFIAYIPDMLAPAADNITINPRSILYLCFFAYGNKFFNNLKLL